MSYIPVLVAATALVASGCAASKHTSGGGRESSAIRLPNDPDSKGQSTEFVNVPTFGAILVPPARDREILVMVGGGPVKNQGERWFPEGSSLASVLDWAGLDPVAPPRRVLLIDAEGHAVRCRVAGRPRRELERVKISHGTRIVVPWDRCFGLGPNSSGQPTPGERLACNRTPLARRGCAERWVSKPDAIG